MALRLHKGKPYGSTKTRTIHCSVTSSLLIYISVSIQSRKFPPLKGGETHLDEQCDSGHMLHLDGISCHLARNGNYSLSWKFSNA